MRLYQWFICVFLAAMPCLAFTRELVETTDRFHPTIGLRQAVSTQEARATKIAMQILNSGGNAVDAACAAGFALAVTLPRAGGLGGGGFMTVYNNKTKTAHIIDFRETAPQSLKSKQFYDKTGHVSSEKALHSPLAAGVPGTVAGLLLAQRRYGRLTRHQILKPAIDLASHGFAATIGYINTLKSSQKKLEKNPNTFMMLANSYHIPRLNQRIRRPELAWSLKQIDEWGGAAFYKGAIAKRIVRAMQANQGQMTRADLKAYRAIIRTPLHFSLGGWTLIGPPPPSSGTLIVGEALQILNASPCLGNTQSGSAKRLHCISEVLNLVFEDRNQYLGDPLYVSMPINRLSSIDYATKQAKKINPHKHTPPKNSIASSEGHETTHLSVMDRYGNAVSMTYSLNSSYGSGQSIPQTGIILNNTMNDFAIDSHPNAYGLRQGQANAIRPGARPLSSMTPIILLKNNNAVLATGSPGGPRIISTVLQFLIHYLMDKQSISESTASVRIHSQNRPDTLYYEQGLSPDTISALRKMGHQTQKTRAMGSLQTTAREGKWTIAYADTRRTGAKALAK